MSLQNNRKMLLMLLLVLFIARFAIVPIFDWQAEKIDAIAANSNNLNKTEQVMARAKDIAKELAELEKHNQMLKLRYFTQASAHDFKLKLQQQIESLFAQHDLKINNFSWVAHLPGDITQERASVSFKGEIKNLVSLQLAIAQLPILLNIAQWDYPMNNMTESSLGNTTQGRMILIAYNVLPTDLSNNKGED
ncbi:MAG: hypothetical protein ACI9VT_000011 [Psychroserpens sp.]|jgi:hypothetical protein